MLCSPIRWLGLLAFYLTALSVRGQSISGALTVSDPYDFAALDTDLHVGNDVFLTWDGGVEPYEVSIIGSGQELSVATGLTFSFTTWTVSLPTGSGYQVQVKDSAGTTATSNNFAILAASASALPTDTRFQLPYSTTQPPAYTSTSRRYETSSTQKQTEIDLEKTSSSSSAPTSTATSSSLNGSTTLGIAVAGGVVGLMITVVTGFCVWRKRRARGGRRDSSSTLAVEHGPDAHPYNYSSSGAGRPGSSVAHSFVPTHQTLPPVPPLVQQYSNDSQTAYLNPSPQVAQTTFGGPPSPNGSSTTGFLTIPYPAPSTRTDQSFVSPPSIETAQDRRSAKSSQGPRPMAEPVVVHEVDAGQLASEAERLPPVYNSAWNRS